MENQMRTIMVHESIRISEIAEMASRAGCRLTVSDRGMLCIIPHIGLHQQQQADITRLDELRKRISVGVDGEEDKLVVRRQWVRHLPRR